MMYGKQEGVSRGRPSLAAADMVILRLYQIPRVF